ncbi:MAG: energy transducer TonB [Chitinophagaceae bacterium]|nr:energy transducer TonB [Chitinophagaceae bacterium]MBP8116074.1 energy transducer TonB [Chitinophagaceae bacterium]HQZ50822.1 energy transducer TonB [Chitinophagaceae bacterium]
MQTNKILSAPLIDLIFDGRNKEYGAYYLRKTYEQRIKKSLLVTFSVVALIIGGTALAGNSKKSDPVYKISGGVDLIDLPPDEKIPEPPPKQETPPPEEVQVKQEKLVEMEIVEDDKVIEPPPSQDALAIAKIGDTKLDGILDDKIAKPEIKEGIAKGILEVKRNTEPEQPYTTVQVEAQFIGDWIKFLKRNLDPETPTRNDAPVGRYTVVVQFVVDKEGVVSDIKALTNHGYGLEAEAVRVLKKAPKWKPAIQNGYEVKAYRKQLITFDVLEE